MGAVSGNAGEDFIIPKLEKADRQDQTNLTAGARMQCLPATALNHPGFGARTRRLRPGRPRQLTRSWVV